MKKSLSSLELAAILEELQSLVRGRITQIYHQETKEQKEILLQIHISDQPKQLLKIIPGKLLCLTNKKNVPLKPSSFCMQLRKYMDNIFIKAIKQVNSERIIIFELEKKEKYYLIVELYSKGNFILTDLDYKIIALSERQTWKDRELKIGEIYRFPEEGINWKEISEEQLNKLIQKSDRKNLATSLAMDLGLGGLYAEELCKIAKLDKNKLPAETTSKDIKLIQQGLKEFLKQIKTPCGFVYTEQITPFELLDQKPIQKFTTYNQAIDTLNPYLKSSPYEQKIKALEKMIEAQQQAISKQEKYITDNTKKAELIYEKYQPLYKLLEIVKEMRKNKEWKDVENELKKEKKIVKVDLKNKKVTLNL